MSESSTVKIVEKPWGREIWVAHTDKYAFKIIEIKKGTRSSLQYHVQKHEHIYVDCRRAAGGVGERGRARWRR